MKNNILYKPFGENAVLIEWLSKIDETVLADILAFQIAIEENLHSSIVETQNTYHSLLVFFNSKIHSFEAVVEELKKIRINTTIKSTHTSVWEIPVCYALEFGIDLKELAQYKGLSIEKTIELHTSPLYTVYFIGFLPGFLYLGGLNESLTYPRKKIPRTNIQKGAVAIGGAQTGVYPQESPGGWNIIGNSPIELFDALKNPPCIIKAGDKIQFRPISKSEHTDIREKIQRGIYSLKLISSE